MLDINTTSVQIARQYQKEQLQAFQCIEKIQKSWNSLLAQKKALQVQLDTRPAEKKFHELTKKIESFSANVKIILSAKDMITKIPIQTKGQPQTDPKKKISPPTQKSGQPCPDMASAAADKNKLCEQFKRNKSRKCVPIQIICPPTECVQSSAKTVRKTKVSTMTLTVIDKATGILNPIRQKLDRLSKKVIQPIITVTDNVLGTLHPIQQALEQLNIQAFQPVITIIDKVTGILNPIRQKLDRLNKNVIQPIITITDKATGMLNSIKQKLDLLHKKVIQPVITIKDKATGTFNQIKQKLDLTNKKIIQASITIKDKVTSFLNPIRQKLDGLNKKVIEPVITVKDKITKKFQEIKDQVTKKIANIKDSMKRLADNPVIKMTVKLIQTGLQQEKQRYAVAQTVARTNQGQSPKEIAALQNSYYNDLKKNAYQTAFSREEVMSAGSVALEATGGKTGEAMELVKVAENMAALNPGKSLAEAIEALTSLKAGNTEQMQDFGLQATSKDVQQAGGVDAMINMKIKPFFAGGADQLMNTGGGLIATIQEKLSSKFNDLGLGMVDKLKPHLQSISDLIDRYSPVIDKLSGVIADGFGWAMTQVSSVALPALDGLGQGLEWVADVLGKYKGLGNFVKGIAVAFVTFKLALLAYKGVMLLVNAATQAWKLATMGVNIAMKMSPIGMVVLAIGALVAAGVFLVKHWETVKKVAETVWTGIAGFFTGIVNGIIGLFQSIGQAISDFFVNAFQTVMTVIQPIIDAIQNALGWVQDIGKGIGKFVGGVASWITGDKKKKEKQSNPPNAAPGSNNAPYAGGSSPTVPGFAVGLTRVPRDNYPALLHEGERVLTKREAMLYDRRFDTVQVNAALERTGSRQNQSGAAPITIAKIAESIIIREEADIQKIANALAASLEAVAFNYAGR